MQSFSIKVQFYPVSPANPISYANSEATECSHWRFYHTMFPEVCLEAHFWNVSMTHSVGDKEWLQRVFHMFCYSPQLPEVKPQKRPVSLTQHWYTDSSLQNYL